MAVNPGLFANNSVQGNGRGLGMLDGRSRSRSPMSAAEFRRVNRNTTAGTNFAFQKGAGKFDEKGLYNYQYKRWDLPGGGKGGKHNAFSLNTSNE